MANDKKKVIVICGPTAVGKTAVAIQLAKRLGTKIISADSRQCYSEMTIGVAKPSAAELAAVQHYFINSHSIREEVNAAVFEKYALAAADEILRDNDTAIMVGGTGLYIKAFTEGIDEIPEVSPEIRIQLNEQYQQKGLQWLQEQVERHDPVFWKIAEQKNPHRLLRSLEVVLSTGKSIVEFRTGNRVDRSFEVVKIGLQLPKEQLHERIHLRVDQMLEEGLVAEVESLLPFKQLKALQTVGYREIFDYLEGNCSLETAVAQLKTNTRQYAKRQMTWFKKDPSIKWYNVNQTDLSEIIEHVQKNKE